MIAATVFSFLFGVLTAWLFLSIVRRSNYNGRIWKETQRKQRSVPSGEKLS